MTNEILRNLLRFSLLCMMGLSSPSAFSAGYINDAVEYSSLSIYKPVVLSGEKLNSLISAPTDSIAVYSVLNKQFRPISFQIDKKDSDGYYTFSEDIKSNNSKLSVDEYEILGDYLNNDKLFDENDECVFMMSDAGSKLSWNARSENIRIKHITEVKLRNDSNYERFVYVVVFDGLNEVSESLHDYVKYDPVHDVISTDTYKIGFSKSTPVLINEMKWINNLSEDGFNFIDGMKVNHNGVLKFFGMRFDFVRNQNDYNSRTSGYKDGLIRVIRKTENNIRMFWGIDSPAFNIDYVAYSHGFSMINAIDLPFSIGTLFDDVTTDMLMAWSDDVSVPLTLVYSDKVKDGAAIDGDMSSRDIAINNSGDQDFIVSNQIGDIKVSLTKEDGFQVKHRVIMLDGAGENYGNVGFHTSNWENVDNDKVHQMLFDVLMISSSNKISSVY
ncbi:MAG: hypothetical protein OEY89_01860 [Gammaproteobacteria bacterium]|nr:hypothetical protein [Gammaproteobacteria bacterium]